MNEVNTIETNNNKKYQKKKKIAPRSYRHNKETLADSNIYHKPCQHDSKLQQHPIKRTLQALRLSTEQDFL